MKRSSLVLLAFLAVQSVVSIRQNDPIHPPLRRVMTVSSESADISISSEEDSFEEVQELDKKNPINLDKVMHLQQKQFPSPQMTLDKKKNTFFDRPSSEELEAYDAKVQNQNNDRFVIEEDPLIFEKNPKPMKPKMGDADEKVFLAALGQIYLEKLDEESRDPVVFPGPMGPPPPVDYDYYFVPPIEAPGKKEANNNGNNNVHVNVNHVQVNSNVLHVPEKDTKSKKEPVENVAPIIPAYHYSEPTNQSEYVYFHFNLIDCVIFGALVVAFVFATKKAYQKCFPKTIVAPQLPTTLPPTYSPSTIVVETVSKKTPQ